MASTQTATQAPQTPQPETHTRLSSAKNTVKYMLDPQTGPRPATLRTRALLRSARYVAVFLFWRVVRYAKYAAVGAAVAAVSGTVLGSVVSGAAFVIAPTGILGGAGMGVLWAVGKFGWRRARARFGDGEAEALADPREDEMRDAEGGKEAEVVRTPRVEPW